MELSPSISSLPVACIRLSGFSQVSGFKVVETTATDQKRCVNYRVKAGEGSPPLFPLFSLTRFFRSFSLTESLAWATLPVRLRRSACGTSRQRVAMTDGRLYSLTKTGRYFQLLSALLLAPLQITTILVTVHLRLSYTSNSLIKYFQ